MAWYFDGSDHVTLANSPALDIPNDSWTFAGWFRLQDHSGTDIPMIMAWGVPNATPNFRLYMPQADTAFANTDNLSARIIDASGTSVGSMYVHQMDLSAHLNKWLPWCFTHNGSNNQTHIRMADPATGVISSGAYWSTALGAITNSDITAPLYLGASSNLGTDRFTGDIGENTFIPGTFFDVPTFRAFVSGTRGYKFPGCAWHVPMIGGRYEEWMNQLTLSNTGSTDSENHPPSQLITPKPSVTALDVVDPLSVVAASPLSLEQSASYVLEQGNPCENTLALTQDASYVLEQGNPCENTLALTQDASYVLLPGYHSENTLALTDAADYARVRNVSATSEIELGQLATYVGPKWVEAYSVLALDQSIYVPLVLEVAASSQLVLSQDASVGGTRRLDAESVIVLDQYADTTIKIRSATSQIELTQEATVDFVLTAHSQINLTQSATAAEITRDASSTLELTQNARHEPFPQTAESHIELSQSVRQSIRNIAVSSDLVLSHAAEVEKPVRLSSESSLSETDWITDLVTGEVSLEEIGLRQEATLLKSTGHSVEHLLSFRQDVGLTHVRADGTEVSATSTLTLTQEARVSLVGRAGSIINLTHDAQGWAGRPGDSQLELTQEASYVLSQSMASQSTLAINHAATYTLILASTSCQYTPFVGASSDPDAPTPPSETIDGPMAGIQVPFQLVYPSVGAVTDSVSLKTPNLGNLDRLAFNRVLRETRGGTLVVFADPIWPKIQTLVLSFSRLLRVEAYNLMDFIEAHLGLEIGLIDWEHRYWRGVITTPDEPVIEDRFDSFTANFEFQGELDPTWNPQVVPANLRYSATRSPQVGGYYVPNEPILPIMPEATDYHTAEAGATIKIGNPLYLTGAGIVNPAQANAAGSTQVVGVSISDTNTGFSCTYITEGRVERTDWTEIVGTVNLSPGITYFLDADAAGKLTSTAPTTVGQYVVRVGRAVDTTTLDIEIELPILL
jgi:hypothetical protein